MEIIKNLCAKISETSNRKNVQKLAMQLSNTFNIKGNKSIREICELAYWLYIYDQNDVCFDICDEVCKTELTDDAVKNDLLSPIYTLYIRLLKEKKYNDQIKKYVDQIIASYQRPKTLNRILGGSLLYYENIDKAQADEDIESERYWKFAQFIRLCFICELGGSDEFPAVRANNEMNNLKIELSIDQTEKLEQDYSSCIQKGANDENIDRLKTTFQGVEIPQEFIDFYKLHDGQIPYSDGILNDEELLSIDRILEEYNIWKGLVEGDEFENPSSPDPGIKNDWYNLRWIPFTSNGCGDNICLDLDPSPEGTYGQVIRMWHDNDERTVEANSFTEYLELYLGKNYLDRMK